jgi:hypothetical protein
MEIRLKILSKYAIEPDKNLLDAGFGKANLFF